METMNKFKRNFLYLFFSPIFGCFLFIFPNHAIGQVYYCGESKSTGFNLNEKSKSYEHTKFNEQKFIINVDSKKTMIMKQGDTKASYNCVISFSSRPKQMSCHDSSVGYIFNFDAQTGRFVWAKGFGYAFGDHDSVSISYGICETF